MARTGAWTGGPISHTTQAEGRSLQKIADQLNAEGVPTLSGHGRWQKGTIGNLLSALRDAVEDEEGGC